MAQMGRKKTEERNGDVVRSVSYDAERGALSFQRAGSGPVKLAVLTAKQLLAKAFVPRLHLLTPWLRQGESVLLYAPTGAGKSFFALSLAVAVAGGGNFLGWDSERNPTGEGWRVAYVDGEMHAQDTQERLRGLLAGARGIDRQKALQNLWCLSRQSQPDALWFPSLTDAEGVAFFCGMIAEMKIDLIILDNFSTLGAVEDENAAASFNEITDTLLGLKRVGVASILVHHTGKDESKSFRGSSKLAATFEIVLKLNADRGRRWKAAGGEAEGGGTVANQDRAATFATEFEKVRSGREPAPLFARLDRQPSFSEGEVLSWRYEAVNNPRLSEIKQGLAELRWTSQKHIAAELGVDEATVSRDMKQALRWQMWAPSWPRRQFNAAKQSENDLSLEAAEPGGGFAATSTTPG